MDDKNRKHRRLEKSLTLQFCLAYVSPQKWDISTIENISAGGVKFIAPKDFDLNHKTIQLQIKIPELAPRILKLEAIVLNVKPRFNNKSCDVRAKFINLTEADIEGLTIVEEMIKIQEFKDATKVNWKVI